MIIIRELGTPMAHGAAEIFDPLACHHVPGIPPVGATIYHIIW